MSGIVRLIFISIGIHMIGNLAERKYFHRFRSDLESWSHGFDALTSRKLLGLKVTIAGESSF